MPVNDDIWRNDANSDIRPERRSRGAARGMIRVRLVGENQNVTAILAQFDQGTDAGVELAQHRWMGHRP